MRYIQTFKHPILFKLFVTQFIIYLGTWLSLVAINTLLIKLGASEITIAVITAAAFLPGIVIAPLSGTIIDRFSTTFLMRLTISIELSMTLLYLTIDSLDELWILFILIFLRSSAASLFFVLGMALLPKIISGHQLQEANEIHTIIWSVTYTSGMALGGILVYYFGIYNSFLIDAALFFVAFFIINIKLEFSEQNHEPMLKMMRDGFVYLKKNPDILMLLLLHSSIAITVFDLIVTLLADLKYKYLIAVPLAIGWLNAVRALALLIGQLILGKYIHSSNLHIIFGLQGSFIILWALVQFDFYLSLAGMFCVGLFTASLWSYTYLMIQNRVERAYLGRVIAYNDMIYTVQSTVTTFYIGYAVKGGFSLEVITVTLGIVFIIVAFWYKLRFLKTLD